MTASRHKIIVLCLSLLLALLPLRGLLALESAAHGYDGIHHKDMHLESAPDHQQMPDGTASCAQCQQDGCCNSGACEVGHCASCLYSMAPVENALALPLSARMPRAAVELSAPTITLNTLYRPPRG